MLLGCRRAGVTGVVAKLDADGLINHSTGRIGVIDRQGLRAAACSCYSAVSKEDERVRYMALARDIVR